MNRPSVIARKRRIRTLLGSGRLGSALTAFAIVAVLFAVLQKASFTGGQSFEFCHYGEIGRRFSAGEGYRTGVYYPAEIAVLDARKSAPVTGPGPVLSRFPLHAALVALSVKAFGARDGAVLAVQGFELASAAAVAAFVFFPLAGGWGALAAALLFALSPSVLRGFAFWGYPDALFAALLLAFNDAWLRNRSARLLGALAGLAWLARPNFLLFLPVYALHAWRRAPRSEETFLYFGRAAIALLMVVFPYCVYQLFFAGSLLNPNFIWNLADGILVERPGWHYFRIFSLGDFGFAHALPLLVKGVSGLLRTLGAIPTLWQMSLLLPFAVLGFYRCREARGWFRLNGALLALQIAVFSFLRQENLGGVAAGRYYLWFAPTLALAAVLGVRELAARFHREREALAALVLAAGIVYAFYFRMPDPGFGHPAGHPRNWPEIAALRASGNDTFVATNIPAHLGWYAGKRAVLVPDSEEGFERLMKAVPVGSVFLSTLRIGELPVLPFWLELLKDKGKTDSFCKNHGFRILHADPSGLLLIRSVAQP